MWRGLRFEKLDNEGVMANMRGDMKSRVPCVVCALKWYTMRQQPLHIVQWRIVGCHGTVVQCCAEIVVRGGQSWCIQCLETFYRPAASSLEPRSGLSIR